MSRLVLIVFYVEVGLVLAIGPWSTFWERNYFSDLVPLLHAITTNDFVRGAISGLGLLNLAVAIGELRSILMSRHADARVLSIQRPSVED
jgi:hypothetical protein